MQMRINYTIRNQKFQRYQLRNLKSIKLNTNQVGIRNFTKRKKHP